MMFLILSLLFFDMSAASVTDWQGEWGQWSVQGAETYGANITIFDCSEKSSSCRLRFEAENNASRCSENNEKGIELKIPPSGSAIAQFVDYDKTPKGCSLEIKIETVSGSRQLRVSQSGTPSRTLTSDEGRCI